MKYCLLMSLCDHPGEIALDQTTWTEVKKYCKQHSAVPQKFSNYERVFSKSGYFPADEDFQCYLGCLAIRSDLMILGNELSIDWRKLRPLFPKGKAYECQKRASDRDPCKKAYQYFNCLRKGNNVTRCIVTNYYPKTGPNHSEKNVKWLYFFRRSRLISFDLT